MTTGELDIVVPVQARGRLRGAPLDAPAQLRVEAHLMAIVLDGRAYTLPFERVDGLGWHPPTLRVYVGGGALDLDGDERLERAVDALRGRLFALPELARGMHALGSRRGGVGDGSAHDRFFAALLDARRRAERTETIESRLEALEPRTLAGAVERTLASLAAERFPASPPDRRALEAELEECAEGLLAAIAGLEERAAAVRAADESDVVRRWREWTDTARRVFETADRCWLAARPALGGPR